MLPTSKLQGLLVASTIHGSPAACLQAVSTTHTPSNYSISEDIRNSDEGMTDSGGRGDLRRTDIARSAGPNGTFVDFHSNAITAGNDMHMHIANQITNIYQISERTTEAQLLTSSISTGYLQSQRLPSRPICLLERESQRDQLVSALLSSANARISILGVGGVGKTALAVHVLEDPRIIDTYPNHYFISFEGLASLELVYTAISNVLGIPPDETAESEDIASQIVHRLAESKCVLCLDNFETFWEPAQTRPKAEDLLSQLSSLPCLALIVTLRGTLRPAGVDWSLPLLSPLPPLTLEGSELLLHRIAPGDRTRDESDSEAKCIRKLLAAVEGLPLAVTLISNLLRDGKETPESLWKRWCTESTRMVRSGSKDSQSDRQSKLDLSLSISVYGPVMQENPNSRLVLAAIAIVPDGLSTDKIESLQQRLPSSINLGQCILSLRNVALLTTDQSSSRIRLLSPIRQFCLRSLSRRNVVVKAMIELYLQSIVENDGQASSISTSWTTQEITNVKAVIEAAYSIEQISDTLVYASIAYSQWMQYLRLPGTDILHIAISALANYPSLRGECLRTLAETHRHWGRFEAAVETLQEAISIHKKVGCPLEEANDLETLGSVYTNLESWKEAKAAFKSSLKLFKRAKLLHGQGRALHGLAAVYMEHNQLDKAKSSIKDGLTISRTLGDPLGEVNHLNLLGEIYVKGCSASVALETLEKALELSRQIEYLYGQVKALHNLGEVYIQTKDFSKAHAHLMEAISLYKKGNLEGWGIQDAYRALDFVTCQLSVEV